MNEYQDRWSRWHHKKCVDGEPSSNNGWIYSAYARKCGLAIIEGKLWDCWHQCWTNQGNFAKRSPGIETPPFSRDELLGVIELGVCHVEWLIAHRWLFSPYPLPPFNPLKTIAALWRMRNAHRNALWMNGGEPHLFRFAFSVPLHDRAWMLRRNGQAVPLFYRLYEWLSKMLPGKSKSSKLIHWLKYGGDPPLDALIEELGQEHPIVGVASAKI